MVCTLLDTCGHYFDRGSSKRKLDRFLVHFQRYILSKGALPLDIEFDLQVSHTSLSLFPSFFYSWYYGKLGNHNLIWIVNLLSLLSSKFKILCNKAVGGELLMNGVDYIQIWWTSISTEPEWKGCKILTILYVEMTAEL